MESTEEAATAQQQADRSKVPSVVVGVVAALAMLLLDGALSAGGVNGGDVLIWVLSSVLVLALLINLVRWHSFPNVMLMLIGIFVIAGIGSLITANVLRPLTDPTSVVPGTPAWGGLSGFPAFLLVLIGLIFFGILVYSVMAPWSVKLSRLVLVIIASLLVPFGAAAYYLWQQVTGS